MDSPINVTIKTIITNGLPSADTFESYDKKGYTYLSSQPAIKFHPYAKDGECISFFAKPINKEAYDAHMETLDAQIQEFREWQQQSVAEKDAS